MGILFSHTIAAGLYYFRNGRSLDQPAERNGQRLSPNQNKHDLAGDDMHQQSECLLPEDTTVSIPVSFILLFLNSIFYIQIFKNFTEFSILCNDCCNVTKL